MTQQTRLRLKSSVAVAAILGQIAASAAPASAFCGFYVAKADTKLFNTSSRVVLSRDGRQTAVTMASDYEGRPDEFALVVPVPTFIEKGQISVVDPATVDHLDAYSAPRLVQYYDPNPCQPVSTVSALSFATAQTAAVPAPPPRAYPGVTVEARYNVAEYDISILSAEQSGGLVSWLTDNGYRIPAGAEPVVGSYIKQKMHFFVAKVNLKRMGELGRAYLRPLQVRYATDKFMLPLRLGTVNAKGPQDLTVYALTRRGRVEAANYRTVKMPSDVDVPLYIATDFPNFYKATFERAALRQNMQDVFVEYAWDMKWCDPCAAQPMSSSELSELGAQWAGNGDDGASQWMPGSSSGTFMTRLHVRYDAKSFPEDINFIETGDRESFQARYVMHHPFVGGSCAAANVYRASLPAEFKHEAENVAALTGWPQKAIEARMATTGQPVTGAQ